MIVAGMEATPWTLPVLLHLDIIPGEGDPLLVTVGFAVHYIGILTGAVQHVDLPNPGTWYTRLPRRTWAWLRS
ncbi:hypothetical protein C4552_01305 [Candidatus Parcubacteria bacterium]|nr:MAG: hypothetical protein C4552_01305 [Candidatus Parcubacteria bacterium]